MGRGGMRMEATRQGLLACPISDKSDRAIPVPMFQPGVEELAARDLAAHQATGGVGRRVEPTLEKLDVRVIVVEKGSDRLGHLL